MTDVARALDFEQVRLLLVLRGCSEPNVIRLRKIAEERGIPVRDSSKNDMWRMAKRNNGVEPPPILALVGRKPDASIDEVLAAGGLAWLLAGARYPVNIGFTIRTAEVSGSNAVFVDGELSHAQKKSAKRASMKAHRFMPVHWVKGDDLVRLAKSAGFRVVALEDTGSLEPWEEDLTGDVLLVLGGEKYGISDSILGECDSVLRVPMSGFVPSYNLQAPMAIVAAEALRQRR